MYDYDDYEDFDGIYRDDYEPDSFEEFSGTYAQEVGGYSDQEIRELFDGDPDMYWNID